MSRPPESISKVAAVFGVTRQAVHKWMHKGAPMYSAEALVDWLSNQMGTRVLDNFSHRCPVLLENLKAVMEPRSVYNPDKELAEMLGVTLETIAAWRQRGAPVENMAELAEWVMSEPGIFEGRAGAVKRNQNLTKQSPEDMNLPDDREATQRSGVCHHQSGTRHSVI